ncbi:Uncharacterized protein TCM_005763 [Theobroma cacao]|uniref:Ubiquitin-like protease family profile domain-containing protein n=1 Tax=Theobroma cacao TaxID=3641 RepID=A0A061DVT7_THECC|nr:Uncharacterized protein TCM_005763 [Theobroma cacao]
MLLDVYPQGYFYVGLLHSIMIRRITERQSMDHELWFAIGKSKAQLSNVKLQALLDTFREGNFQRPGDATKMALILIANNILFGQDYCRWVTPWLLSLVEDIDAWNVFLWGHYVWKLTLDYLLKGFEVPDLSVIKETRLHYNIYGFTWFWAMEAISALQKIVTPSEGNEYVPIGHMEDRSDWGLGARQKKRRLKEKRASGGTKRIRTVAALVDELMDEGDDHGQGSEQPLDHGPAAPEPPISPPQMQSGNDPSIRSFTKARTGPQAPISPAQSQTANEQAFTEAMTGLEAPISPAPPQTTNEPTYAKATTGLEAPIGPTPPQTAIHGVSQCLILICMAYDVVEEAVAVDVTLQSDDAEGEHLPLAEAFVDAAAGAMVLYRESTLDVVEIQSSSLESSAVHHDATEISDPTERARLKMVNKYMASPFVDPLVTRLDVRDKIVEDYEAFKKEESARRNVGILGDQGADFFITLEDPNEEMTSEHIYACLSLLCKRMTGPKSKLYITRACMVDTIFFDTIRMLHTEFPTEDARAKMQIPDELRGYVEGERPTYAKKWEDVDFILAPCNVGGHWVVAKIDLVRWTIKVVDSTITSDAKDNGAHAGQMTPLTTMMSFI